MKISVIGPCGGGKSTLSRAIAKKYGLEYLDLDEVFVDYKHITPDNVPLHSEGEITQGLHRVFRKEGWIMEGIYDVTEIFEKADLIILIIQPIWQTLFWQWKRYYLDSLERKRFGFVHNLILSQIILNQYFSRKDYYHRVGIDYPTVTHFRRIVKKYHQKSELYPLVSNEDLFGRIDLLM